MVKVHGLKPCKAGRTFLPKENRMSEFQVGQKKKFSVISVAGAVTGRLMGGMDGIYDVMGHFCDGISTLGLVVAKDAVTAEIYRQSPTFKSCVKEVGLPAEDADMEVVKEWIEELKSVLRRAFPEGMVELETVEITPDDCPPFEEVFPTFASKVAEGKIIPVVL
jgi:hypothetical protein